MLTNFSYEKQVASILAPETLSKSIAPVLILLSKDVVPNIRMNAAKALKLVIPLLKDKSADVMSFIVFETKFL